MANVELVVKIPEEIRLALINNIQLSPDQQFICDSYMKRAIIDGKLLPKGHSNLIDIKDLYEHLNKERDDDFVLKADAIVSKIKPIIEADKESEGT